MKKGDTVSVLDEDLTGIITLVNGFSISVETSDGFVLDFDKSQLVVIDNSISKRDMMPSNIDAIISEKENNPKRKSTRIKPKDRSKVAIVMDLHIHKLVKSEKGMNSYDKLTAQVNAAKGQLEFAIRKKIPRVVFVHGVGEGVLRSELETLFRRYDTIRYEDADYKEYGRGATEVFILQNVKS